MAEGAICAGAYRPLGALLDAKSADERYGHDGLFQ